MTNGLVALGTFLAAAVEWVEALTIVLAVGMVKSWRTALFATSAALGVLVFLVVVFGFAVTSHVSVETVRTLVGIGLLLFGLGWLYKAILRSSGLMALHDEGAAFEDTREEVMTHGHAFGTAFGGVFLEGLEVVFIVVALGGLKSQAAAVIGALLSLLVICVAGVLIRKPLTRVPENAVKYTVGLMLTSFGTFFAGEGLGVDWWNGDVVLLPMIAGYALASLLFVTYLRWRPDVPLGQTAVLRWLRAAVMEVWGLFVTDGTLAIFAIAALLFVAVFIGRFGGQRSVAGWVLVAGVLIAIAIALRGATTAAAAASVAKRQPKSPLRLKDGSDSSVTAPVRST